MSTPQLLVSGDYWHSDFRGVFSTLDAPATMVPLEKIASLPSSSEFLAVVLAQSRRDQFSQSAVDVIRRQLPDTPIVNLLGSWCEGQNRSGNPLSGVTPVLWHQWDSQFERFCRQIVEGVATHWHHPLTATVADRVRDFSPDAHLAAELAGQTILISAESRATFETLADMLELYRCQSLWAEESQRSSSSRTFAAVLVDGNSASEELLRRVARLKDSFGELPALALLNFPRKQCFASLAASGIKEVVSKPFTHCEILESLTRAMKAGHPTERTQAT